MTSVTCVQCPHGTARHLLLTNLPSAPREYAERAFVPRQTGDSPTNDSCATIADRTGPVRRLPRVTASVFAQALAEIIRRLDDAQARHLLEQYALIGGFAVSAWGVPRATHDLDFALALGSADPVTLSRHLQAEFQMGDPDDPLLDIFRTSVLSEGRSVPVQLVLLRSTWTQVIFRDGIESLEIFGCMVPIVSWQSLVLLKLYAGGPQDLVDGQQIFAVRQPTQSDLHTLSTLADQLSLSAAWERFIAY